MKKLIFLTALLTIFITNTSAQATNEQYVNKVQSLDSTLYTLYAVISGEKGAERDWELFKFLFHPDAKLIPARKKDDGLYMPSYMTPEEYVSLAGTYLVENGFFEKEIHRVAHTFGAITQVFSTYESFHSEADEAPFMRGINSIQLLNDGKRWWIINIYWTQESKENPIPKEFLGGMH
jgi:hypothetical protein